MSSPFRVAFLAFLVIGVGCTSDSGPAPADPAERLVSTWFTDVSLEAGLERSAPRLPAISHILEAMGSGVSVADIDLDGDDDLYVPRHPTIADYLAGRPGPANQLYRNNGDGTFTEVAAAAGVALRAWSHAAYFADVDNDGDPDLFIAAWGPNHFFENKGDGTFADVSQSSGLRGLDTEWTTSAAFTDLDKDGFLDLFVVNYCGYDPANPDGDVISPIWRGLSVYVGPKGLVGQQDHLYRNNADGTFTDISQEAGLSASPGLYGLGVVAADLDRDGDEDVYVANDSVVNQLWRNDGRMPLVEVGAMSGTATNESALEQAGMGVALGDVDGDGLIDILVTNFSHDWNTLYSNEGGLRFRDATFEAGLSQSWDTMGWGLRFLDIDRDGDLDLGIANGHTYPQVDDHPQLGSTFRQPNTLLNNLGGGRFEPLPDAAWSQQHNSRGLAVLDYDLDGDEDVIVTHLDAAPTLLRNEIENDNHWVAFRLEGTESNRDGIGARIEVDAGGKKQTLIVNPFGSYQSQSSLTVHVGVGDATFIDKVTIHWPSIRTYEYADLESDRTYVIREGSGVTAVRTPDGDSQ